MLNVAPFCLTGMRKRKAMRQRKDSELVPIGEVIADLPGPVQAIRDASPPTQRGFTLADQVNLLV